MSEGAGRTAPLRALLLLPLLAAFPGCDENLASSDEPQPDPAPS